MGTVTEIAPDGSTTVRPTGANPIGIVVAPPGVPNAGFAYVANLGFDYLGNTVTVIKPSGEETTVTTGIFPGGMDVAAAGTPHAGTVYVANSGDCSNAKLIGHTLTAISPTGATSTIAVGRAPFVVRVAGAGTPNAGTLFVANYGPCPGSAPGAGNAVTMIEPNGRSRTITVGTSPRSVAIAPAGTPNAGTAYVPSVGGPGFGILTSIKPDGTTTTTRLPGYGFQLAVAPAGTPNAGKVYIGVTGALPGATTGNDSLSDLAVLQLDGTVAVHPLSALFADGLAIAPAGTPSAGSVYVTTAPEITTSTADIDEFTPVGTSDVEHIIATPTATGGGSFTTGITIAPAGAPNAGTVYVGVATVNVSLGHDGSDSVVAVTPAGAISAIPVGNYPSTLAVGG